MADRAGGARVADLGSQIVTGATALLAFSAGLLTEAFRHRWQRQDRARDELRTLYGKYISALRRIPTDLAGLASGLESFEQVHARGKEAEELVGPVRLVVNDEVRRLLDELSVDRFYMDMVSRMNRGMNPQDAAVDAWSTIMRDPIEAVEDAMRRQIAEAE
jgi:hypothetical protein